MNTDQQIIDLVDRYLKGELEENELIDFKLKLESDAEFASSVKKHAFFAEKLNAYGQRLRIKEKVTRIQSEIPADVNEVSSKKGKLVPLIRKNYPTISIAASVALITAFSTFLILKYVDYFKQQQTAYYQALRKDVENIKRSQTVIIKDLNTSSSTPAPKPFLPGKVAGTGFVISSSGYLITGYHVIKGADSLYVENKTRRLKVNVIYRDEIADLALLKVVDSEFKSFGKLPYAFKASSAEIGEKVFTLGYPRKDIVYGEGSVSAMTGFDEDTAAYQVSIPVNPGNSGGPLLDEKGNVVGMITGRQTETEGAGFAIKSQTIQSFLNAIPGDSLKNTVKLSKSNSINGLSRSSQVKKIKEYIFEVKIYN